MRVKRFFPFVVVAFVVVCLVAGLVSFASATVIFSDGFESQDFGAWTHIYGSPDVVSDVKYAGSYGAFVNASGTHSCYYGAEYSAGWGNHLFARGYYKFDVSTSDWVNRFCTYISNWSGSDDLIADVVLGHWQNNEYHWALEVLNGTSIVLSVESSNFALNTSAWYCIELEVFIDGSAGYAKMYVDDVLVASLIGVDNNKYGNPNHVGFGQLYYSRSGEAVWWDCCVIADSYIGLELPITPNLPPTPVTLYQAANITQNSLRLSWTKNTDVDFKNYTIYQSNAQGNLGNTIYPITDKSTAYYVVTALSANTTYYFTIRVYDTGGLYSDSNQVGAKTNAATPLTPNLPPTPVTLYQAANITQNSLRLSWTKNTDVDFKNYTIYRSITTGAIGTAITAVTSSSLTSYDVTGLSANTTYYFMIRVYDAEGLYADSNRISATTSSAPLETLQFPLVPVIGGLAVAAIALIFIAVHYEKKDRISLQKKEFTHVGTTDDGK
jgi:hypothetical protein